MLRIPGWIIRRLSEIPTARVEAPPDAPAMSIRLGGGPRIAIDVVPRLDLSSRETVELALQAEGRPAESPPRLWAIEKLRPQERQHLAAARWSWVERRTGFLHLDLPPYFIHDLGTPATDAPPSRHGAKLARPTKLVGLSGRCAESLVLWAATQAPNTATGETREMTSALLATLAAVSLPLANKVLNRLADEDAIRPTRRKQRTFTWAVTDPARILELWAAEDTRLPRITSAYVWARSHRDLLAKLVQLDTVTDRWAVGGVTAANCYAPLLTADPKPTIWIPDRVSADAVLRALGGERVTEGGNITLQQMPNDPWAMHRLRNHDYDSLHTSLPQHIDPSQEHPLLREAHTLPSPVSAVPGLALVSRPRAYVETVGEQRGRSAEVAEHLLSTLATGRSSVDRPQHPVDPTHSI